MRGYKQQGNVSGDAPSGDVVVNEKMWVWEYGRWETISLLQEYVDRNFQEIYSKVNSGRFTADGYRICNKPFCFNLGEVKGYSATLPLNEVYSDYFNQTVIPVRSTLLYRDGHIQAEVARQGNAYFVGYLWIVPPGQPITRNYDPDYYFIHNSGDAYDLGPSDAFMGDDGEYHRFSTYTFHSWRHIYELNNIRRKDGTEIPGTDKSITYNTGYSQYKHNNIYYGSITPDNEGEESTVNYKYVGIEDSPKSNRVITTPYGWWVPGVEVMSYVTARNETDTYYIVAGIPNQGYLRNWFPYTLNTIFDVPSAEDHFKNQISPFPNKYLIDAIPYSSTGFNDFYITAGGVRFGFSGCIVLARE